MYYDKRNRAALAELAPNTKAAALKWYDFLKKEGIDLLIYDARRTEAEQRANVASGASQTMKSYHLVGQALDFVPVKNGKAIWNGYESADIKKAIKEAKRLGFEWGGDWRGFVDKPHLQYNYKGYGTDKTLSASKPSASKPSQSTSSNDTHKIVYGDTLSGIAEKYNTTVAKLKEWNNLKSDRIDAGDVLKVKKPSTVKPQGDGKAIVPFNGELSIGSKGKDVERVQRAVGAEVTGSYSAGTKNKVLAYQKRKKLKETGKVDLATWNMLF